MTGLRLLLSWILVLFLIGAILHWTIHPLPDPNKGFVLLYDLPGEHLLFSMLAERSGLEIFEPGLRVALGGVFLLAALMMLISPARRFGAILTCLCCGMLILAHLSPWGSLELAGNEAGDETDGGAAFYLTVAVLTAAALLVWIHPRRT